MKLRGSDNAGCLWLLIFLAILAIIILGVNLDVWAAIDAGML